MPYSIWFIIIGALLIVMALSGTMLKRMPLSTSFLYLGVGLGLGHHGLGILDLSPVRHSLLLERLSEVAVLISLFTAGLKLNAPFEDTRWALPFRLAFVSMAASVGL
ncbi:MAG TPA: hypothetical protein VFQ61_21045, partial [Polyangiaceae bacterium]|nr:hypothetical protein [Polyangiaceae bacterium]